MIILSVIVIVHINSCSSWTVVLILFIKSSLYVRSRSFVVLCFIKLNVRIFSIMVANNSFHTFWLIQHMIMLNRRIYIYIFTWKRRIVECLNISFCQNYWADHYLNLLMANTLHTGWRRLNVMKLAGSVNLPGCLEKPNWFRIDSCELYIWNYLLVGNNQVNILEIGSRSPTTPPFWFRSF